MGSAHRKGTGYERDKGQWLLENDGECPKFGGMATSTARMGQQTNLGFDLVSTTYAGEAKNRKSGPKWLLGAWKQIVNIAAKHQKQAVLFVKCDARKYPEMHIITEERHAELLKYEKMVKGGEL